MEAGLEPETGPEFVPGPLAPVERALEFVNAWIVRAGGVSMLATGLSRKETVTHMTCSSCGTGWDVA